MDWDALRLSLQVGIAATALSVIVGVPLAWQLARKRSWARDALSTAVLAPMVLPPTVVGYFLLQAVGRNSAVGSALDAAFGFSFVFDWTGAVLAAFLVSAPFLVRTAQAGFEAVDAELQDAARTLGRTELSVFLTVTLPIAWRSVMAGVALGLARAVGEFGATLMIAGSIPGKTRTMPIAIYEAVQTGQTSEAQALAAVLTFVALGLLAAVGIGARGRRLLWR